MSISQSRLPQPQGRSPEQLFTHSRELVRRLERLLEGTVESADWQAELAALQAQLADQASDIADLLALLNGLSGSGLTPQQGFIIGLVTAVDTVLGSVNRSVLDTIRISENLAQAAIAAMVRGREDGAALKVEQAVRLTETAALAQQITTLDASLSGAYAGIQNEQTARVGQIAALDAALTGALSTETTERQAGDAALAAEITTLTTQVDGNTAQLLVYGASIDGLEAQYGIAVNLNGQVVGLVQLDGTPQGSTFTVVADKFLVAQPGVSGGTPVPVFAIAQVNGVTKLALRGDMLVDGSVLTQAIAAGAITTSLLAAGSVTADRIAAGAVTADKIAATLVTTTRIQNPTNTSFWDLNTGDVQFG